MTNRMFWRVVCLGCLLLASNTIFAGNVVTYGVAPRAESMQAFTAVADDPSAVFYNPAGITQLIGTQFDNGLLIILPNLKYTNSNNNVQASSDKPAYGGSFFITTDYTKPVYLGFGFYAPYARVSRYSPQNAATLNLPMDATILRLDFTPTLAWQINPMFSVGASFIMSRLTANSNILGFSERGHGFGVTGQLGALAKLGHAVKLGINYRAPEKSSFTGTGSLSGVGQGDFTSQLRLPGVLSAGAAWQATQKLLLSFTYEYEMWDYVNNLNRSYNLPAINAFSNNIFNGKNVSNYRAGVLYRLTPCNELRAGFSYLPAAIPFSNIVPAQPDYNTYIYSVGYSYYFHQLRLDAGYEFAHMPAITGTNPIFPGSYSNKVNSIMLGFGYTFA